ncbi:hypothetical protein V6Z12_D13G077800 [Gossypium hirsutum]
MASNSLLPCSGAPCCYCPAIWLPFHSILFLFFSNFSCSSLQLCQPSTPCNFPKRKGIFSKERAINQCLIYEGKNQCSIFLYVFICGSFDVG